MNYAMCALKEINTKYNCEHVNVCRQSNPKHCSSIQHNCECTFREIHRKSMHVALLLWFQHSCRIVNLCRELNPKPCSIASMVPAYMYHCENVIHAVMMSSPSSSPLMWPGTCMKAPMYWRCSINFLGYQIKMN